MSQTRQISRACNTCKARRVKCDENRPICQRCVRSGRQCAYATDFDRVHRDETRRTQRRFGRDSSRPGASSGAPGPSSQQSHVRPNRSTASASGPPHPSTAVARTARAAPASSSRGGASSSSSITRPNANLGWAGLPGDQGLAALLSAAATETTIFVAGQEVDEDAAAAAASGSRPLWGRGSRTGSVSVYMSRDAQRESSASLSPPSESIRTASDGPSPHPSSTITMPIGEMAMCYFAANFMLMPRTPTAGGFFEYLVPVLRDQAPNSAVQYALRACAFAALGNRFKSDTVDFNAIGISQYTAALAKTTVNLKDPQQSTTDATLATVLLLGLFENITARKELFAWRSHIEGAIHIVQSRGTKRIRTRTEQLLFNSVRLQLIAHSISADTPPPMSVNWWLGESVIDSASARCQRFALEVSQLRMELNRQIYAVAGKQPRDVSGFRTLLLRVKAIDNEMAAWMSSMPANYKYYTLALAGDVPDGDYERADAFPGRVDMYPDLSVANIWAIVRCCRLVMSSFVFRCMALIGETPDYHTTPEYAAVVRRCNGLISDIIASVPYYMGSVPSPDASSQPRGGFEGQQRTPSPPLAGFACGDEHGSGLLPKALAGLLLIWPLAAAYTHDCSTKAQREFLRGRLLHIGNTLGLRYAIVCASTTFRYPSMMLFRDRIILAGTPTAPPAPTGGRVGSTILQIRDST